MSKEYSYVSVKIIDEVIKTRLNRRHEEVKESMEKIFKDYKMPFWSYEWFDYHKPFFEDMVYYIVKSARACATSGKEPHDIVGEFENFLKNKGMFEPANYENIKKYELIKLIDSFVDDWLKEHEQELTDTRWADTLKRVNEVQKITIGSR